MVALLISLIHMDRTIPRRIVSSIRAARVDVPFSQGTSPGEADNLHLFLGAYHGLHVLLVDDAGQALHEHLRRRVVPEALEAPGIRLRRALRRCHAPARSTSESPGRSARIVARSHRAAPNLRASARSRHEIGIRSGSLAPRNETKRVMYRVTLARRALRVARIGTAARSR